MKNSKNKGKKIELSSIIMWVLVIALFGSVTVMLTMAGVRKHKASEYIIEIGNAVGGNTNVYATFDDKTVMLNDSNKASFATIATTGSIYFKTKESKLSDKVIYVTAVPKDESERNHITITELTTGGCQIAVEDANGTFIVSLPDARFSAFIRLIAENSANGENPVVDAIP